MIGGLARRAAEAAVALSTILVIAGAATVLFLNPFWLSFEQGRADASAWTGWTSAQVDEVTGAIFHDLVVGPPDFTMTLDGRPVFDVRERSHMQDVRRAFIGFGALVLAAVVILLAARLRSRGAPWFWRSVAVGGALLAGSVLFLGVFFGLAFDTAFDLFHRLLFAGGSYTFDPRTEVLVQLFPETFWYETFIAVGVVLFIGGVGVALFALRRASSTAPAPSASETDATRAIGGTGTEPR